MVPVLYLYTSSFYIHLSHLCSWVSRANGQKTTRLCTTRMSLSLTSYNLLSDRGAGVRLRPQAYPVAPRPSRAGADLSTDLVFEEILLAGDTKKRKGEWPGSPARIFDVPTRVPFTSLEQLRRNAAFAAGHSTSVLDVETERIPIGEARETLERERARVSALEEKLAILTHHCSTWGRETDRARIQVKAAAALSALHPRGAEHHGRVFATHYDRQHAKCSEELEMLLAEREHVLAMLKEATSIVESLEDRLAVANTSFASRKAVSDSNRQRYFHSLFYYDWNSA